MVGSAADDAKTAVQGHQVQQTRPVDGVQLFNTKSDGHQQHNGLPAILSLTLVQDVLDVYWKAIDKFIKVQQTIYFFPMPEKSFFFLTIQYKQKIYNY